MKIKLIEVLAKRSFLLMDPHDSIVDGFVDGFFYHKLNHKLNKINDFRIVLFVYNFQKLTKLWLYC